MSWEKKNLQNLPCSCGGKINKFCNLVTRKISWKLDMGKILQNSSLGAKKILQNLSISRLKKNSQKSSPDGRKISRNLSIDCLKIVTHCRKNIMKFVNRLLESKISKIVSQLWVKITTFFNQAWWKTWIWSICHKMKMWNSTVSHENIAKFDNHPWGKKIAYFIIL